MKAKILECSVAEYHKDPCPTPSLSSSIAWRCVEESMRHAWAYHPKLGGQEDKRSEAMNKGSVLHKLVLGKGTHLHVMDVDDFRTKAAREERDEAVARGNIPIKLADYESFQRTALRIIEQLGEIGFIFNGNSEVAIQWEEILTGYPGGEIQRVLCRAMLDHVFIDDGVIYDLKFVENASRKAIERNFVANGYDIAHEAYRRALGNISEARDIAFVFLYCETTPPYAVQAVIPQGSFAEIGKLRWQKAVMLWEEALRTNRWPAYSDKPIYIDPPAYVAAEYLGNSEG